MIFLDVTVVNVALPDLQQTMQADLHDLQWVINSYTIAFGCLLLTAGTLAERLGSKPVFLTALAAFTATSAWCALSTSVPMLLAARTLQGVAGAVIMPVSVVIIAQTFPDAAARARAIGLWSGVGGLALATGPVLGGILVEDVGWQSIFWINVPVGTLGVILLARLLRNQAPESGRRLDLLGQLLFVAAVGLLTFALIEGNSRGWSSAPIVASFAGAAVGLVAFALWELRHRDPVLPMRLFRHPHISAVTIVSFLVFAGFSGALFLLALSLQEVNGLSAIAAGARMLLLTVMIAVGFAVGPVLAARIGGHKTITLGCVSAVAGLAGLTVFEVGSGLGTYWWPMVLIGIGVGFAATPGTVMLLAASPADRVGTASSLNYASRQVGSVFGVALMGAVVQQRLSDRVPSALADVKMPAAARDSAIDRVVHGDMSAIAAFPAEARRAVADEVQRQFIAGSHTAYLTAAACCVLAVLASAVLLRDRSATSAAQATPAAPTTQAAQAKEPLSRTGPEPAEELV